MRRGIKIGTNCLFLPFYYLNPPYTSEPSYYYKILKYAPILTTVLNKKWYSLENFPGNNQDKNIVFACRIRNPLSSTRSDNCLYTEKFKLGHYVALTLNKNKGLSPVSNELHFASTVFIKITLRHQNRNPSHGRLVEGR